MRVEIADFSCYDFTIKTRFMIGFDAMIKSFLRGVLNNKALATTTRASKNFRSTTHFPSWVLLRVNVFDSMIRLGYISK